MTTESAPTEVIVVVAAVIEDGDRFLLTRRQAGVHLEGFWEFPGGKVDVGETHEAALIREMREELDVDVTVGAEVFAAVHRYPDRRVALHFLRCGLNGEPRPMLGQAMAWVERDELRTLRFPEADAELIARLTSRAL